MPSTCYSCFDYLSMFISSVKHRRILLYSPLILFWAQPVHMKIYIQPKACCRAAWVQYECSMTVAWFQNGYFAYQILLHCSMITVWMQHGFTSSTIHTAMQHDCSMIAAWQFCIPPKHAAVQHVYSVAVYMYSSHAGMQHNSSMIAVWQFNKPL